MSMKVDPNDLFKVRVQSIPVGRPLTFEIYMIIDNNYVLFRKKGDLITEDRMKKLISHNLKEIYVPLSHKKDYSAGIKEITRDDTVNVAVRCSYIKESAYNHVQDLFEKPSLKEIVSDSKEMVSDMISLVSSDLEAVTALLKLSAHDTHTYNHCVNVSIYMIAIAKKVLGNKKDLLMKAGMAGLVHDLGMRKIDSAILNKQGSLLNEQEKKEFRKHPEYGVEIIRNLKGFSEEIIRVVHEHHEKVDGSGYPRGLKDNKISPLAKIAAIADVFDNLMKAGNNGKPVSGYEALQTMQSMQPGSFDNELFSSFDKGMEKKKAA